MGGGYYDYSVRVDRDAHRQATGSPVFAYSVAMDSTPVSDRKANKLLDPKRKKLYESRDSADHPNSRAILNFLDVTGSMSAVVDNIHAAFPTLQGTVLRRGYLPDAQYSMSAIGDATCDIVPVQIGEFESDNRIDETLEAFYIEGRGGAQKTESYELALFIAARMTAIDCYEKRGEKGYLFLTGDEMAYLAVSKELVKKYLDIDIQDDIPLKTIVEEAQQKYNVYFIIPQGAQWGGDTQVLRFWQKLLGENVYTLQDAKGICELMATIIAMNEAGLEPNEALDVLAQEGVDPSRVRAVSTALAGRTGVARASGQSLSLANDVSVTRI